MGRTYEDGFHTVLSSNLGNSARSIQTAANGPMYYFGPKGKAVQDR